MKKLFHIVLLAAILAVCFTSAPFAYASDIADEAELFSNDDNDAYIKIALIDTGVTDKHALMDPDKILTGRNYVFNNEDTEDRVGHGTYIASIIIGAEGIAAASEHAAIVPLVYYGISPSMPEGSMVTFMCSAIYDAIDVYGCRVINISAGIASDNRQLKAAVEYAESMGAVVVSAVGNANEKTPSAVYYPAAYESVIGVGAVDGEGKAAAFSQRNESVMIAAKGVNIPSVSLDDESDYMLVSGTSYSTAFVSALAADLLSQNGDLTPAQIRHIITATAKRSDEKKYDTKTGYGVIDKDAAMEYCLDMISKKALVFIDVREDSWYFEAIDNALSLGYMNGVKEDRFMPDACLTRAMTAAALQRKAGVGLYSADTRVFKDVPYEAWYKDAVSWAYNAGVVTGYAGGTFRPDAYITREDFCVMLYRLSGEEGVDDSFVMSFSDSAEISQYAYDAVKWAVSRRIINGTDKGEFKPKSYITRAQAAAMLTRG
ncbi:MAG: S-layer homology domain-containing protein [Clostridia bacterium]|nr:S-layer homology domain-containing protein [Clostridia bacterium]